MGLADWVLDRLAFTGHSSEAQFAESILELVRAGSGVGGVNGLLRLLGEKGMGKEAATWVSTGQNRAVSAEQMKRVFEDPQVAAALRNSGVSPDRAAATLAAWLPFVINFVTPIGKVPRGSKLTSLLASLQK